MKGHVEDLSDKTYSSDDWEDVVHKYTGFLCAAAKHTMRLNSSLVKTATKNVFKPDPKVVNDFGDAMAGAMSYCYAKAYKATSGKKLSESVKAVILSFDIPGSMEGVQTSLSSPDTKRERPSSAGSSAAPSRAKIAKMENEEAAPPSPPAVPAPVVVPGLPNSRLSKKCGAEWPPGPPAFVKSQDHKMCRR